MTPLRIIILAILAYILYRLLFRKKRMTKPPSPPAGSLPADDVLVEDPVCHTYVPSRQAIRAMKDGRQYYFCSDTCCQKFLEDKGEGA